MIASFVAAVSLAGGLTPYALHRGEAAAEELALAAPRLPVAA